MSRMTVNQRNQYERSTLNQRSPRLSDSGRRAMIITTVIGLVVLAVLSVAAFQVFEGGHHWIVIADLVIIVFGLAAWCLDPDWNPGGIWRPVSIETTGAIRIQHLRVLCRRADATRADVAVRAVLDASERGGATITTAIGGTDHSQDVTLASGENQLEWTVAVAGPRLWWPKALGDQPLEEVTVEVTADGADRPSHRRTSRTGLRQVSMRAWVVSVNGERLFVKGANHGPTRMALAEASPEEVRRDVDLAVDCGLDLLRVHAHVARPELYDAADEAGLLLWQDMPLQWGYAGGIRKQAVRQAREAVDLLGHHPSVVIWCGHNEPFALDVGPGAEADPGGLVGRYALAQELPTWNKTVLDRSIKRAIEKADGSRPVIAHSGVLPHPPTLDGTDSHLYFGWYHGDERDLPDLARRLPRLVRWVGEFGAQAVPETADFLEPGRWPDLDWERLGHTHALQKRRFDERVPPAEHVTFRSWQAATQAYQATLIKHHVETLRRLKYRPTGGFAQFCFADGHPAVTWSVLDHERVPKAGYEALKAACRPVVVVADRPPATRRPGRGARPRRARRERPPDADRRGDGAGRAPLDGRLPRVALGGRGRRRRLPPGGHAPAGRPGRTGAAEPRAHPRRRRPLDHERLQHDDHRGRLTVPGRRSTGGWVPALGWTDRRGFGAEALDVDRVDLLPRPRPSPGGPSGRRGRPPAGPGTRASLRRRGRPRPARRASRRG